MHQDNDGPVCRRVEKLHERAPLSFLYESVLFQESYHLLWCHRHIKPHVSYVSTSSKILAANIPVSSLRIPSQELS